MSTVSRIRPLGSWILVIVTAIAGAPLLTVSSFAQAASVSSAALPNLPKAFLDTTYALPSGKTISVQAGGNFQGALNAANPGDVIVLQAGATYSGNFTLPNKAGTGWIYIQSSALASLPTPGFALSILLSAVASMKGVQGPKWKFRLCRRMLAPASF